MNSDFINLIDYANNEFNGSGYNNHAYNGMALIPLLQKISCIDACDTDTYEGYSVIEIVLHLAYCKYWLVKQFGSPDIGEYPYYKGVEGFFSPGNISESTYSAIIEYLIYVHKKAMTAVMKLDKSEYEKRIEAWDMSFRDAAVWICNHDTYHIAQIRNMGIQVLKKKKISMDTFDIN